MSLKLATRSEETKALAKEAVSRFRPQIKRLKAIAAVKRGATMLRAVRDEETPPVVTVALPVRTVENSVVYEGNGKARPTTNSLMKRLMEAK